jgi:hypothetical protein
MKIWMLTQFTPHGEHPDVHAAWPVAASYSDGHRAPRHPDDPINGWGLVLCEVGTHHIEAANQDPRVHAYRTVWDTITPETVAAYAAQGAKPGMMLCQLLSLLAAWEPGFGSND